MCLSILAKLFSNNGSKKATAEKGAAAHPVSVRPDAPSVASESGSRSPVRCQRAHKNFPVPTRAPPNSLASMHSTASTTHSLYCDDSGGRECRHPRHHPAHRRNQNRPPPAVVYLPDPAIFRGYERRMVGRPENPIGMLSSEL